MLIGAYVDYGVNKDTYVNTAAIRDIEKSFYKIGHYHPLFTRYNSVLRKHSNKEDASSHLGFFAELCRIKIALDSEMESLAPEDVLLLKERYEIEYKEKELTSAEWKEKNIIKA